MESVMATISLKFVLSEVASYPYISVVPRKSPKDHGNTKKAGIVSERRSTKQCHGHRQSYTLLICELIMVDSCCQLNLAMTHLAVAIANSILDGV